MTKPLFPPVDRETFLLPAPTMQAIATALLGSGIARLERLTQAEYDAIPTPRPSDVLYIVTP